jgi:haloalkane dehalogenase
MMPKKDIRIAKFRHLYPFDSHFVPINGLQYHYLDEGAGEAVMMIHGNPTWSFYYRELIKALSPNWRVIVPDHIGCGFSEKPAIEQYDYRLASRVHDLESLINHLNLKHNLTLVLHDWGGIIGMAYAVDNRSRIGRLIVLNTAAFLPPNGKRLPLRLWLVKYLKPLAIPAVRGFNLFAYGALFMASYKGLAKDVKAGLIAPYDSWKNRIATLKFVEDIPMRETDPSYPLVSHVDQNLTSLKEIPMLICWGERDFVFDKDYLAEWQRRFPEAEVHSFSDAGHYVLEDVPHKIVPLVKNFLSHHPL